MATDDRETEADGRRKPRDLTPKQRRREVVDVLATGILGMIENGDWPPAEAPEATESPVAESPQPPRRNRYAVFNWTVTSRNSHVVTATFERVRATATRAAKSKPPSDEPARVTLALVRAHLMQRELDSGRAKSLADLALQLGLTRARVTQLMDLLLLAPDIQEEVLLLRRTGTRREPISERDLRSIVRSPLWSEQRAAWARLKAERGLVAG